MFPKKGGQTIQEVTIYLKIKFKQFKSTHTHTETNNPRSIVHMLHQTWG